MKKADEENKFFAAFSIIMGVSFPTIFPSNCPYRSYFLILYIIILYVQKNRNIYYLLISVNFVIRNTLQSQVSNINAWISKEC